LKLEEIAGAMTSHVFVPIDLHRYVVKIAPYGGDSADVMAETFAVTDKRTGEYLGTVTVKGEKDVEVTSGQDYLDMVPLDVQEYGWDYTKTKYSGMEFTPVDAVSEDELSDAVAYLWAADPNSVPVRIEPANDRREDNYFVGYAEEMAEAGLSAMAIASRAAAMRSYLAEADES
jgi:hypothetical protein